MRALRILRSVLWSLTGIRRGADSVRDLEDATPRSLIATGLAVAAIVVLTLVLVTRMVVPDRRAVQPADRIAQQPTAAPEARAASTAPDTLEERLRACTACHGQATEATKDGFSPRLAGKPAGYLFNQLASFRDGRRGYPPMVYLVQYMTDDYLREMAEYFARLELPYPPPEAATLPAAAAARAKQIVEHGDPARNVPACTQCHGDKLAGVEPGIPGLLGLPRTYVTGQFGGWRSGKLRSVEPDCMAEVARRLAPDDAPLLAAWLASQSVPASAKPEAPRAGKLPLECGSLMEQPRPPASAAASPAMERGRYLATAGDCIACHTTIGGAPFAGGRAIETPFGSVYASNITPDVQTGIGGWSADDFWRAFHDGRSKDGRLLYPAFPYANFTQVSREDADAIFGYLRSLPPVARRNTPHEVRFPYSTQAALWAWRAFFFQPGTFEADRSKSAQWNRGAYLVRGLGHCDACHAARNMFGAVSQGLDLGGGLIPMQKWYAPPLVTGWDKAGWDIGHIEALLKSGATHRATAMGPMAEVVFRSTQHLSPEDARAIGAYLHAFSARQDPPAPGRSDEEYMRRGANVYREHCADCHGAQGQGVAPAYPALAGNASVTLPVAANSIKAVLNGGYPPVTAANPRPYGMPPYFNMLSDADVAAVLTYVRGSWGNAAGAVSTLDVERYR